MEIKRIARKIVNLFLIIALLASQINFPIWNNDAYAIEVQPTTTATKYFYRQLDDNNKRVFYKAMETMLEKGFFKKGNVSIEIPELQSEALDYSLNEQSLLNDMGAARDAFMLDYPELFYVDFDYLSLRITTDEAGIKHVYLGTGRGETYINQEFLNKDGSVNVLKINNAIDTINNRIDAIVAKAQGQSLKEQIKIAHDEVIKAAKYTLEFKTEYPYTVRTIYGVFGLGNAGDAGNAVCEGYARALKTILDRLGIPALLVRGVYDNVKGGTTEEHMWVYVQLDDGQWYGVDPTFDNKDNSQEAFGNVSDEYLIVSAEKMNYHYPIGIISSSDFKFTYPELNGGSTEYTNFDDHYKVGDIVYFNDSGLVVKYEGEIPVNNKRPGGVNTEKEAIFSISYNGMGYIAAREAEDANYIIIDGWHVKTNATTGVKEEIHSGWSYPTEVTEDYKYIYEDRGTDFLVRMDNYTAFQVGVTKVQPGEGFDVPGTYDTSFHGELSDIKVLSEAIETQVGEIEWAAPYVKKTTPSIQLKQRVGKTYHVTVEYDQDLIYEEGNTNKEIGYELLLYDLVYGYREDAGQEKMQYTITTPKLSADKRTITFDFTPSKLWTYDETLYIIKFTGIVGEKSKKQPNSISYAVTNPTTGCIFQLKAMGVDLEAYGKPTLMDDFDLKDILPEDLNISDEMLQKYGDLLKHRLQLVTTEPTPAQETNMEKALQEELAKNGRKLSEEEENQINVKMYNISLSLCTEQLKLLTDGTKIKIMLGFPEGYGPESAGVTFKAYHYTVKKDAAGNEIKDEYGNVTYDIEEIDCEVTERGLIIYVSSFSPFAIAALTATQEEINNTDKKVVIKNGEGGNFDVKLLRDEKDKSIITLKEGETRSVEFNAKEGYTIDKVFIGDTAIDLSKDNTKNYSLNLSTIDGEGLTKISKATTINAVYMANDIGWIGNPEKPEEIIDPKTGDIVDSKNLNGYVFDDENSVYEFDEEKNTELKFSVSIPHDTFKDNGSIYVDNNLVNEIYYNLSKSSSNNTIITFTNEFIKTLQAGEHIITFKLNDETEISKEFNVKKTTTVNPPSGSGSQNPGNSGNTNNGQTNPGTSGNNQGTNNGNNNTTNRPSNSSSNNSQTSVIDIGFYTMIAIGSLLGIIYMKRKEIA